MTQSLCVVGGGNMAQAILRGALDRGRLRAEAVVVVEPDEAKRRLLGDWGLGVVAAAAEVEPAERVLLAVKPQMFGDVAAALRGRVDGCAVLSIMAGVSSGRIREGLGEVGVVRVMPNTPSQVGKGMTALAGGEGATPGDVAFARELFEAVGEVIELDESLMDAFTGVAGSGPAYVFYLAEAMVRGAVGVALDPADADRIVRATVAGAAALLEASPESAEALRAMVTSKGGTTAAATGVLDEAGVMGAVVRAIAAARDRGRALGG